MYVIKVGKYYVKRIEKSYYCGYISEILLSCETMTGFENKKIASDIAKQINGIVKEVNNTPVDTIFSDAKKSLKSKSINIPKDKNN